MLVALLIAAIPLVIISRLSIKEKVRNNSLMQVSTIMIVVLLLQIVIGTQVREQIDEISKPLRYQQRELWIAQLDNMFLVHRSFSWLVAAGCIFLWWKARPFPILRNTSVFILVTVAASIGLGLVMAFNAIPAWAQPLHLLTASALVLSVFSFRLKLK